MLDRAMLLTPPGAAAIAVVRIHGPSVAPFLQKHFSRPLAPSRAVHGELRDEDNVIDDPIIVLADDGTGADINLHGGEWVIESTFALLAREGFERVEPLADAFDASTSLQREMLESLPHARTEAGLRMLLAQPAAWERFKESKPDEAAIAAVLDDICLNRLLHPARVAIIGPPNVGKSTLANQLFAQDRSITADLPGTTRDWVGEIANIEGVPAMLIDTPGERETDDAIERAAISRTRGVIRDADLIIHVLAAALEDKQDKKEDIKGSEDKKGSLPFMTAVKKGSDPFMTADPSGGALRIVGEPRETGIVVLNKFDLLRDSGFAVGGDVLCTVATTGEGIEWLRRAIRTRLGCRDLTPDRPRCWTDRQRDLLRCRALDEV
jgi:small GTP-binding protein